MELIKKA